MWIQPLFLTLQLIGVSVTIAAIVGVVGAWAASILESSGRFGRLLAGFFLASMVACVAVPMILHAAAWEATAGKFGWLPLTQTGSRASGLTAFGAFGGLAACGWIHGLVGSAMVALATWHGTRIVPASVIDQAQLEQSVVATWWRVRLPLSLPWLTSGLLATALLAATEMTVVDLYGFRTVADEFYLFFAVSPTSTSLVVTCVVPIAIATVMIVVMMPLRRQRVAVRRSEHQTSVRQTRSGRVAETVAGFVVFVVAALVLFVPIAGLLVKVGHQVRVEGDEVHVQWSAQQAMKTIVNAPSDFSDEYRWTLMLSMLTGLIAMVIAFPLAAWAKSHDRVERLADLLSVMVFVIPGPIVGLLIVRIFQWDVPGFAGLYQRTLLPTIMALSFRAVPLAYWVLRAGYHVIDPALVDAARLDGTVWRRMWLIDRRMMGTSFFVAFFGACVMASGDVPAALPVIPPGVTTVGTRLFGLLHSGARQQEAALAVWYVAAVVLFALVGLNVAQKRATRL